MAFIFPDVLGLCQISVIDLRQLSLRPDTFGLLVIIDIHLLLGKYLLAVESIDGSIVAKMALVVHHPHRHLLRRDGQALFSSHTVSAPRVLT
jgi:hypothetical protein